MQTNNTITGKKPLEFWQINSIKTTAEDFKNNGMEVISFGMAKSRIMAILKDKQTALKFHLYNDITDNDEDMKAIYNQLEKIVFKESRGSRFSQAIGWENGNSYLRYHSGIIYKWFK